MATLGAFQRAWQNVTLMTQVACYSTLPAFLRRPLLNILVLVHLPRPSRPDVCALVERVAELKAPGAHYLVVRCRAVDGYVARFQAPQAHA
jgi:hypothetical protein